MYRKRKELFKDTENDEMARAIREIPFRLMAEDYSIEENFFVKKVYQDRRYTNFFLSSNCQRKFSDAAKILMSHSMLQVQDMFNEKENQRANTPDCSMTYSNIVSTSLVIPAKIDSAMKKYEDISPSALSEDYKSYTEINFVNDDNIVASLEFGKYHASLVELFLRQMRFDERMIVGIILYGNSAAHKQQRELFKKFSTAFCNDVQLDTEVLPRAILKSQMLKKA